MDKLELRETTLVGHSTGGGEVTRYVGRHGTARVKQMVLISAIPYPDPDREFNPMRASELTPEQLQPLPDVTNSS